MDVTVDNFSEALEMLKDAVKRAEFVAFDLEFSGLSTRVQSVSQRENDALQMAHNRMQVLLLLMLFSLLLVMMTRTIWTGELRKASQ